MNSRSVPEPTEEKYEYYFELEGQKAHLATTEDFGDDIIEGLADGYAEEEWRKTERKLIWRSKAEAESGADPIGHLTRRPIGLSQSKEV